VSSAFGLSPAVAKPFLRRSKRTIHQRGEDYNSPTIVLGWGEGSARWRDKPSGPKSWPWAARRGLKDHPTAKPTAMLADALLDLSNRGDIVIAHSSARARPS
jgi:DNA modification methylase